MECKDRGARPDASYYPVQIKSPLDFTPLAGLEADLPGIPELLPSSSAGGLDLVNGVPLQKAQGGGRQNGSFNSSSPLSVPLG